MDYELGRIMSKLKQTGLDRKTVVALVADHGFALGEHSIWGKTAVMDITLGVPMMLRIPGKLLTGLCFKHKE